MHLRAVRQIQRHLFDSVEFPEEASTSKLLSLVNDRHLNWLSVNRPHPGSHFLVFVNVDHRYGDPDEVATYKDLNCDCILSHGRIYLARYRCMQTGDENHTIWHRTRPIYNWREDET